MNKKSGIIAAVVIAGAFLVFFVASAALAYEAAPYSETLSPTFVTEKSIQLNGRVNPNEMPDTYEWFEWGIVGLNNTYETRHDRLWSGSVQINTNVTIMGLAPEMQYFYRQVSENGRGKHIGQTAYVTTKPLALALTPMVIISTNDAVFINETSAALRGYVSPHGNSGTKYWFEWGTKATMENRTSEQGSWGDSGPVEAKLQQLIPGTLYYFRAVAMNEQGRSYGAFKTFTTAGVPPALSTETPRMQYVSSPVPSSNDGITRTVTTSGVADAPQASATVFSQASNKPGDFLSMLLGGKKNATAPALASDEQNGTNEAAGVSASGFFENLLNMFTGKKPIEVVVEKVGPAHVTLHTPVEYRIAYVYRNHTPASDAKLRITLPSEVIYIGDNTNNELLLETGAGAERTYMLPVGRIEQGTTRTMSIMGMTTGDAEEFPDARVRLEYNDKSGMHVVAAQRGNKPSTKQNSASAGNVRSKILPSSFLGWGIYLIVVIAAIIGIRKAKAYYLKRKELLANQEIPVRSLPPPPQFLPGAQEITPQGV